MKTVTAKLSNYRQAPRKVRLIADFVRGKRADRALASLSLLPKRGAQPINKLILSAVANANMPASELYVSKIEVGGGVVFKRMMPRARGRGSAIKKKTSNVTLELAAKQPAKGGKDDKKHEQGS